MSKNTRFLFSFIFTLVVFAFLWMYSQKNNQIEDLKSELEESQKKLEVIDSEYQACKGENFHKQKLLDMEKRKSNQLEQKLKDKTE